MNAPVLFESLSQCLVLCLRGYVLLEVTFNNQSPVPTSGCFTLDFYFFKKIFQHLLCLYSASLKFQMMLYRLKTQTLYFNFCKRLIKETLAGKIFCGAVAGTLAL